MVETNPLFCPIDTAIILRPLDGATREKNAFNNKKSGYMNMSPTAVEYMCLGEHYLPSAAPTLLHKGLLIFGVVAHGSNLFTVREKLGF